MRNKVIAIRIRAIRNRRIADAYKSQMNNQPTRGTLVDIFDIRPEQKVEELSGPVKGNKPVRKPINPVFFSSGGSGLTIGDTRIFVTPSEYRKGVDKPVEPTVKSEGCNDFKERLDVHIRTDKSRDDEDQ